MRPANLALKFFLELAALASCAIAGWQAAGWAGALLAPTAFVVAWGLWAAPRARHRLSTRMRVPFELGAFVLAFAALAGAGHGTAAAVLGALTVLNAALLTVFGQWEH